MPRQGRKRKKTRTEKEADPGERQKKLTPRCFVIKRGDVGDRIKDLVQDFRNVMMPNSAKALKESKQNRVEDFIAVASHFSVTHLIIFSATKAATYMKLARLPQGPTLTFRVDSFTLAREVRAAQKRPQGTSRDFVTPPLQVLNGLGGPKDSPEGAGGGKSLKMSERQLVAEMLRGAFPAIDVPTFNQAECRRAVLFHFDRENDAVFFRHFVVGRRQLGVERGIKKLTRFNRLPNLAGKEDIADFVMGGGGVTSESEVDESAEEVSVASLTLPDSLMRNLMRSTVPKYRFEKDVFKGMNRLAQAFACYVTDRSLHELKREQTSKGKKGSKNAPVLRKTTLTAEHVMRFLQQDMPQLANKLASLHPDKMPEDFKPSSVKLLKQLHEQIEASAAVDSLEVNESFPELPEIDFPILSPKGVKKRKAAEAQDDAETKEKPKKATRSLSAFFTKTTPQKESGEAETLPEI